MINITRLLSTLKHFQVNSAPAKLAVCPLCLGSSDRYHACPDCIADFPLNKHACRTCALPLPFARSGLCGRCLKQQPSQDLSFAPWLYRFPVDRMISRYKYQGSRVLGRALADAWLSQYQAQRSRSEGLYLPRPNVLIPCPMHPEQLQRRGFNQASELASHIGLALNIPVDRHRLIRTGRSPRQATLTRAERLRNLKGNFRCLGKPPARVAIIDDVITTGATADALCNTLRAAGAEHVQVWALARTP